MVSIGVAAGVPLCLLLLSPSGLIAAWLTTPESGRHMHVHVFPGIWGRRARCRRLPWFYLRSCRARLVANDLDWKMGCAGVRLVLQRVGLPILARSYLGSMYAGMEPSTSLTSRLMA